MKIKIRRFFEATTTVQNILSYTIKEPRNLPHLYLISEVKPEPLDEDTEGFLSS